MLEIEHTAPDVAREFTAGNYVIKESAGVFNQVHTDMALEHVNKLCQIAGGIVAITRLKSALDRWMPSCCDLACLSDDIRNQTEISGCCNMMHGTYSYHKG